MPTSLPFPDSCSAYPIILGNDNVTRFSHPLGVNFTLPGDPTWEQPHPDDDPPVWCFGKSAASYLELNFTVPYKICAIETQGVQALNNDMKYVSSYLIEVFEVSDNCSEWKFYNGSGNITVSFLESLRCFVVWTVSTICLLVPSGQDARVANHSARFGWSCPLTELAR